MRNQNWILWQQALVMLMRRYKKRDPAQWKLYFSMYWGAERRINPHGFLRDRNLSST